jgi:tetratricopeptide (TPR) repeat protein
MKEVPADQKLRFVCYLGLALSMALLGASLFFAHYTGWSDSSAQGSFGRELRTFDAILEEAPRTAPSRLNALLDRLEKKALGVESLLSTLKRRRSLALGAGPNQALFQRVYREAAENAAAAFPFSEPLAVLAADALLLEYPDPFPPEIQTRLRGYAGLLMGTRFLPLALNISVLLGDLSDPAAAAALPQGAELLFAAVSALEGAEREGFLVDAVLHSLLAADSVAANSLLVTLLGSETVSERALRFGAEYFYDTNPLRAAELFSRFSDSLSLGRLADSLVLAGFQESAVNIWIVLAALRSGNPPVVDSQILDLQVRSLYNLASAATEEQQQFLYYGELFSRSPGHIYGVIGYSRLLDTERAAAILAGQGASDTGQPALLDLELLRRRLEGWELQRTVAETWLLLGRHPREAEPYRWGAWYFARQRQFLETALLLRQARMNGVDGPEFAPYDAFRLIREGRLAEAETLLEGRSKNATAWQIPANLGLIMESRRALSAALDQYERAAALAKNPLEEARVRLRMARCLRMLGRNQESRDALERVLELDSGNINARLELLRGGE